MGIINGNGNKTRLNMGLGMGMGMNHWEWEGMGLKKIFPLISSVRACVCASSRHEKMPSVEHSALCTAHIRPSVCPSVVPRSLLAQQAHIDKMPCNYSHTQLRPSLSCKS